MRYHLSPTHTVDVSNHISSSSHSFFPSKANKVLPGRLSAALQIAQTTQSTKPQVLLITGVKWYKPVILYSYFDTVTLADFSGAHSRRLDQKSPL